MDRREMRKGRERKIFVSTRDLLSLTLQPPERLARQNVLTLAVAHLLKRRLVAKAVFARLYDERKTRRDALSGLGSLAFLGGSHRRW